MAIRQLDKIFKPQRIALIGVTPNPKSVGGIVLSNIVGSGFRGVVYPVNPAAEAVLGIQCHPDIQSLPNTPDLAVICTAAEEVPALVEQCGDAGIQGIIIISAGFRETGPAGLKLEQEIRTVQARFDGMRILGPNCLGVIVPELNLNVSFAGAMPRKGNVAFISQSGALCTSVLDWAVQEKIGFSHFVSIGNTLDVDFGDLIDYFGEDDTTKSILLYIESITDARKFMTAARAFARTKPIVAYKAGRFPESAEAAASHTGALASDDDVYGAAFQRMGIARVFDIGDIFDCAELIGRQKMPRGPHLAIVTNAGGPGVMATDALIEARGSLAKLSNDTMAALSENLPDFWSHGNPVDVLGDARSKRYAKAASIVLADKNVDALLVILTPQAMTNPTATAREMGRLAADTKKPILAAWLGGGSMHEGMRILADSGIASYTTPEQAVRAFMTLVEYSRNLDSLYETPRDVRVEFQVDRGRIREEFRAMIREHGTVLDERLSKQLLDAYHIPVTMPVTAATEDDAVLCADSTGYPVALKIHSPDITHKTDAGGVILGLETPDAVRQAFRKITAAAAERVPGARIFGVTVQPMFSAPHRVEMILGTKRDPVFGTVLMAGLGGVAAELLADRSLGFPPLNEKLALRMLKSLKVWQLLKGYRGAPPANIDTLVEIMIRLSYLAADFPEIKELDINPLWVTPDTVMALDARIIVDPDALETPPKPFSHLALQPYPEELVREMELNDGTPMILRPIKPEDEPLWMEMLGSCSRESIYMRFRYFFQWATHDVGVRYCFIDYDREIAIVAEVKHAGARKLIGVGRLVADPDLDTVEYAILITDAWQNKGLGNILTDYCIEIARQWGVPRITAQTTTDNPRMIAVFRRRGFEIEIDPRSSMVNVAKTLRP